MSAQWQLKIGKKDEYQSNGTRADMMRLLTVCIALFAFVLCAKAIARNIVIVVDASGSIEAEILSRMAFIEAALLHILMLCCDQRCDGQQIRCRFACAQNHIANAADKRFNYIFDAVQFFLGAQT